MEASFVRRFDFGGLMKYGTVLAVADPRPIPELAQAAEGEGWDAIFLAECRYGAWPPGSLWPRAHR
ncbi:hypothetical protein BH20ACT22_BH20ACT22_16040 [soil metagenome]